MLKALEILFWCAAIVLLGAYSFVYLDRSAYQAYESWAFERKLEQEPAPIVGFLLHTLRFGGNPDRSSADAGAKFTGPSSPVIPGTKFHTPTDEGALIGRIDIPRIGVSSVVINGTDDACLRRAVGHIEGTPWPGETGNVGLAGHRDTFFRGLRRIRSGDMIYLRTLDGSFEYEVESTQVVEPDNVEVLDASSQPALTLVTCFPFDYVGSAPHRFIVRAREIAGPNLSVPAPRGS